MNDLPIKPYKDETVVEFETRLQLYNSSKFGGLLDKRIEEIFFKAFTQNLATLKGPFYDTIGNHSQSGAKAYSPTFKIRKAFSSSK